MHSQKKLIVIFFFQYSVCLTNNSSDCYTANFKMLSLKGRLSIKNTTGSFITINSPVSMTSLSSEMVL